MDCEDYREALSARLDDEECAEDAGQPVDEHLETCVACARWYDSAALITRRTRTTAAVSWPDVTDAVLAEAPPAADRAPARLRIALGAVGVLQCGVGVVALAGATGYQSGPWLVALGMASGVAATGRVAVGALLPFLGALVAVLSWGHLTSGLTFTGAVSHALAAIALVLVVLLARRPPPHRAPQPPHPAANHLRRPSEPEENRPMTIRLSGLTKSA